MKKALSLSIAIFSMLLFTDCSTSTGEEIGRIPINQISKDGNVITKEISLDLKKDEEIAIWSDMDIKYIGDVDLEFKIEVLKDGENIDELEIDPTDTSILISDKKTTPIGGVHWTFSGKNSEMEIEEDGNYTFKGILVSSGNSTLEVNKAEIVLKK